MAEPRDDHVRALLEGERVAALPPVAEFFAARNFAVNSKSLVAGLRLEASDGPFVAGDGPLVTGTTLALVMVMAGRGAYLDELDGAGVETLRGCSPQPRCERYAQMANAQHPAISMAKSSNHTGDGTPVRR